MLEYLDTQKHCLQVERLPGYAPELNPVEGLWSSLKGRELANRCESTIGAVVDAANVGVLRIRTEQLAFSFLDHTPLSLFEFYSSYYANLFRLAGHCMAGPGKLVVGTELLARAANQDAPAAGRPDQDIFRWLVPWPDLVAD